MGISLLDCIDPDSDKAAEKVYKKIVTKAKDLVAVGDGTRRNSAFPLWTSGFQSLRFPFVGWQPMQPRLWPPCCQERWIVQRRKLRGRSLSSGFSALVQELPKKGDEITINSIPRALAETVSLSALLLILLVPLRRGLIWQLSEIWAIIKKPRKQIQWDQVNSLSLLMRWNNMAGAFHVSVKPIVINVGVSGPGVVNGCIEKVPGASFDSPAETVKKTA